MTVIYNEDACAEANKYHGFLVLLADKEKDTFECLRKYRNREHIEAFFEQYKDKADGSC
ncbi:MAG: hypothetical protein LUE27_11420 [Clostridia bacterium]|nr:hypothetical protein [Clostridia bacterium]